MAYTKTDLKIPSVTPDWNLDVWKFTPAGNSSSLHPVIIMAHGFSANKLMGIREYAEAFASNGYACLVFDYRQWGASDGTPRNQIGVKKQLEDYRTVIKFARQQAEFDPQRVVVWGTSFSGGHSISLASEAPLNVIAAIAQCPYTGVVDIPKDLTYLKNGICALTDVIKQAIGLQPLYIPAATEPGRVGGLAFPGSEEALRAICKNKEDWANEITASSILEVPFYKPLSNAKSIHCPILLVVPEDDVLCLAKGAKAVGDAAEKAEVLAIEMSGHFDVYPGQPRGEMSLQVQLEFLKKHVPI